MLGLFEVARGRRHAELLAPAVEFLCRQADVTLDEIGAIAVDTGPGLFTGMRVGIATAKAMAHTLRVPVIPMTSLDLLALPLRHADRLIGAVIDARRGEVYHAVLPAGPGGVQRVEGPSVGPVDDLVADLLATGEDALLVGDGALRYRERICAGARRVEFAEQWLAHPSADAAGSACARQGAAGGVGPAVGGSAAVPAPPRRRGGLGDTGVGAVKILPERTACPTSRAVP